MIDAPVAHVGGIPIEETIGSFGPALVVGLGVAWAKVRDRLRRSPGLRRTRTSGTRARRVQRQHDEVVLGACRRPGAVPMPSQRDDVQATSTAAAAATGVKGAGGLRPE
jgi:hypothetical protein